MKRLAPTDDTWFSRIKEPLRPTSESSLDWSEETDILVVGCGGAGIAAALEASEHKKKVIVIDRFFGGGATAASGGIYYAGGGTSIQKEAEVEDSPEEMFNYLKIETDGVVKDSTLRKFCNDSASNLDWLISHGVQFNSSVYRKKTSYPNKEYFLYHSDNSLVPNYMKLAKPAARGHKGFFPGRSLATGVGITIFNPLRDSAIKNDVQIMLQTEAVNLIVNRRGKVIGAEVLQIPQGTKDAQLHRKFSLRAQALQMYVRPLANYYRNKAIKIENKVRVTKYIKASKGVIISSGGFIFNRNMVEHYAPKYKAGIPLGTTGDNGAGIRLGQSVGGAVNLMSRVTAWRFLNPPLAWGQGIVVNKEGSRYSNEMVYGATLGDEMCENQEGKAILILDSTLRKETWKQIGPGKVLPFQRNPAILSMLFNSKKSDTIAGLAKKCGMSPLKLYSSIEKYNIAAKGEKKDPFGKSPDDCRGIFKGPFYAMDVSVDSKFFPCAVLTLGGLIVDEETGNVQNSSGENIKGLYAAGRSAVGICSNIYVSGLSIGDCIFSGRRAGLNLSKEGN